MNTKYYPVNHPVPRDPSEYSPTKHFLQRKKYRTDPEITGDVIRETIESGTISGCGDARNGEFKFQKTIDGDEWTVVVSLEKDAFRDPERTHNVVTAFTPAHDHD